MVVHISVTDLVGCPYFSKANLFVPRMEYALKYGRSRHEEIESLLSGLGLIVEAPVELELELPHDTVVIHGRIDAMDRGKHIIYEIKSHNLTTRALRQLLLYRDILYVKTGVLWKPALIVYTPRSYHVIDSFLYLPQPLTMLWNLRELIETLSRDRSVRVAGEDCEVCMLRGKCLPDYTYFGNSLRPRPLRPNRRAR